MWKEHYKLIVRYNHSLEVLSLTEKEKEWIDSAEMVKMVRFA